MNCAYAGVLCVLLHMHASLLVLCTMRFPAYECVAMCLLHVPILFHIQFVCANVPPMHLLKREVSA